MPSQDPQLFERFLLGDLPEADREALEERLLDDPDLFFEIELAEEELLDAYVRGELSAADRQRFEAVLGRAPRIQERLRFGRQLAAKANRESTERSRAQPPALAAPVSPWQRFVAWWRRASWPLQLVVATALVLVVGVPIYFELGRTSTGIVESRVLQPVSWRGESRSGEEAPVSLRGKARLDLWLEVEEGLEGRFDVVLRDAAGNELWLGRGREVQQLDWGRAVALELPAALFGDGGHFTFELSSVQVGEVAGYELVLARR